MNTRGRYRPWLALRCEHAYFADGVCRALSVRAAARTARTLAGMGLRLRAEAGGATLYYLDSGAAPRLDAGAPLSFLLESGDPALMQYTEVEQGSGAAAGIWYFDNRGHADGLLNPDGGASRLIRLALMPRRFCWPLAAPQTVSALAVRDVLGQTVLEYAFAQPVKRSAIELDLRDLDDGRYTLLVDGEERFDFFLTDAAPGRTWGAVLLYPELVGADQAYRIALRARSRKWRYLVVAASVPPSSEKYAVVRVSDEANALFKAVAPRDVDGRKALVFESESALPLCEQPGVNARFALQRTSNGDGRTANRALPSPAADGLVDGFFNIYVYV